MAQRVEWTQQANAKEHQRALEAQRKLREMGAPLPAQPTAENPLQRAFKITSLAVDACKARRLRGELPSYVASVQCANPAMLQAFRDAQYKYIDLIEMFAAKRVEIATRMDRGELTEDQAKLEGDRVLATIQSIERQRDRGM